MSWLARRETKNIEDMAYCMFGIFGINTYLRYGEGEAEAAFLRLQEELIRPKPQDESIFAWKSPHKMSYGDEIPTEQPTAASNSTSRTNCPKTATPGIGWYSWAAVRVNYSLELHYWEPGTGSGYYNTMTIHLRKNVKNGTWQRADCSRWKYRWRPRSRRSIFGNKARPIEIPHCAKPERDWRHVLALRQQSKGVKKAVDDDATTTSSRRESGSYPY